MRRMQWLAVCILGCFIGCTFKSTSPNLHRIDLAKTVCKTLFDGAQKAVVYEAFDEFTQRWTEFEDIKGDGTLDVVRQKYLDGRLEYAWVASDFPLTLEEGQELPDVRYRQDIGEWRVAFYQILQQDKLGKVIPKGKAIRI